MATPRRVHQAAQETRRIARPVRESVDGEPLVRGAVEQRARKIADLAEHRIGMIDGRHHVAFAGEVLRQVREERARPRVSVRHHHQRKGLAARRRRVAHGPALEAERGRNTGRRNRHGALVDHLLHRPGRQRRRIPDLDLQRTVIDRSLSGLRVEMQDVDLAGVDQVQGANPDFPGSAARQLGGVARIVLGEDHSAHQGR